MDERIVRILVESDLVLSPVIIAENLGASREGVSRRLGVLVDHNLVIREREGRYRTSEKGVDWYEGRLTMEDMQD